MNSRPILVIALAAGALAGTAALSASHMQHGMGGNHPQMMDHMRQMHEQMHGSGWSGMHGRQDHGRHGGMQHGMGGHRAQMMEHMHQMHDRMHGAHRSGMQGHPNHGRHGGMKHGMHGAMRRMMDADGDGSVTPEEASAQLKAMLQEYDADGSGTLSIAEYEALHSATIREMMVDRFQHLDADGDGEITAEEMDAPAKSMRRMHRMQMGMGSDAAGSDTATEDAGEGTGQQDN